MNVALTEKYRPNEFEAVVGHAAQVRSLKAALAKGVAKAYLFSGPSGVGKTTLAYIAAKTVGCEAVYDVDAASKTGIEDMRAVAEAMLFRPLGGETKAIIVDEVHALSKPAVQSLLKILEKPPSWGYWFLCTTEPQRVLKTVQTRCLHYALKPVATEAIIDYLSEIAQAERLKVREEIIELCAQAAEGSPRQALANLALCLEAKNVAGANALLQSAQGSNEAVELARLLVRGAGWPDVQELLRGLTTVDAEGVRHVVRAYVTKVILNDNSKGRAESCMAILEAFDKPFYTTACLTLACGKLTLQ